MEFVPEFVAWAPNPLTERITTLPGITRTNTHVAIRSYGRGDEATAFDIGID